MTSLRSELAHYGAPPDGIVDLAETPAPDKIEFLDLLRSNPRQDVRLDAIVKADYRPVLYVVKGSIGESAREQLERILIQRGQADYLAVVEPGRLRAYSLNAGSTPSCKDVVRSSPDAQFFIPSIIQEVGNQQSSTGQALHNGLLNLLNRATETIVEQGGVSVEDALSLVGRAVFLRFLLDRRVVTDIHRPLISQDGAELTELFSTAKRVEQTCQWLDDTFNADLLPLTARGGEAMWRTDSEKRKSLACEQLTDILCKRSAGGQATFEWASLDFSHIPVGLLSQVYEAHYHQLDKKAAKSQSVYYTPQIIAQYMVSEAFSLLRDRPSPRVLDPAAGAGVFLTAAFRSLVAARWSADGVQPNTRVIREILYTQLAGFDINESALRLCALGLYLTALELDPEPHPIEALKFESLRGRVLIDVRSNADQSERNARIPCVGALGEHVDQSHRAAYDLVIGNPPWTAWSISRQDTSEHAKRVLAGRVDEVSKVVRRIDASRLEHLSSSLTLSNPDAGDRKASQLLMVDKVPDIPFVWRAMEWARPNTGVIAFALSARLLFKRTRLALVNRNALFGKLQVLGILNGSALRKTAVWPKVKSPFCILFARNTLPPPHHSFVYLSPLQEDSLNRKGYLRIDPQSATPVPYEELTHNPTILKTLFRGTYLDVDLLRRLRSNTKLLPLRKLLEDAGLNYGQGYQNVSGTTPAGELHGLPELYPQDATSVEIDTSKLAAFRKTTLHRPRDSGIYVAPVVLVRKAIRSVKDRVRAHVVWRGRVVYSESFFGISCALHANPALLAKLLIVCLHADLLAYVALMEAAQFGVEREVLHVDDLEAFPIPKPEKLTEDELERLSLVYKALCSGAKGAIADANSWVRDVYGLSLLDQELVSDSVRSASPFPDVLRWAQGTPTKTVVDEFCGRLRRSLSAFVHDNRFRLLVDEMQNAQTSPWRFVRVQLVRGSERASDGINTAAFEAVADQYCASQIIVTSSQCVDLGIVAQNRYWTKTRARLLASEILNSSWDSMVGKEMS